MSHFRISSPAHRDLTQIYAYIAADNPPAAERQIERFYEQFSRLARMPMLGEACPELGRGDLRSSVVGNYVVFYRPINDGIEVVRVLSGYRDIDRLF